MRFLCIDLGEKRTGVAVGDDETGVVSPVDSLEVPPGPRLLASIVEAIEAHGPDAVVVGLPLNMDGTEGPPATRARDFGRKLEARTECPVHFQDERLTTYAADQRMAGTGRTRGRKKELRDALAAAEILRDFLDLKPGAES